MWVAGGASNVEVRRIVTKAARPRPRGRMPCVRRPRPRVGLTGLSIAALSLLVLACPGVRETASEDAAAGSVSTPSTNESVVPESSKTELIASDSREAPAPKATSWDTGVLVELERTRLRVSGRSDGTVFESREFELSLPETRAGRESFEKELWRHREVAGVGLRNYEWVIDGSLTSTELADVLGFAPWFWRVEREGEHAVSGRRRLRVAGHDSGIAIESRTDEDNNPCAKLRVLMPRSEPQIATLYVTDGKSRMSDIDPQFPGWVELASSTGLGATEIDEVLGHPSVRAQACLDVMVFWADGRKLAEVGPLLARLSRSSEFLDLAVY